MREIEETSLGYPLKRVENEWEIDLTNLRIFTGLSVLARVLGDAIIDHVHNSVGDVSFLYKINYNMNPELLGMHIKYIQIYARSGVLEDVYLFKDEFHDHLRSVFGTFQRPVWASLVHPEFYGGDSRDTPSKALIFPFHHVSENDAIDYQFILERVENKKEPGEFIIRLTVEDFREATLQLKNVPHVIVNDLKTRVFIAGSTKMAESLSEKIQTSCKKGSFHFSEENLVEGHVFEQLSKTGLGNIEQINFYWDGEFANRFLSQAKEDRISIIKRLFLSLEDNVINRILKEGETVSIRLGKNRISIYLTRLSRVLNFSINISRTTPVLSEYLRRMPEVEKIAKLEYSNLDFSNIRIFFIHHITSEVLAMIEAYRQLKVEEQNIMFVKYGGLVPSAYLESLLEIPDANFFTASLMRVQSGRGKEYFTISRAYSDFKDSAHLAIELEKRKLNFFEAMKLLSGHFFLKFCKRAFEEDGKVLLIEDGGYLAPIWNESGLTSKKVGEVFSDFLLEKDENSEMLFVDWLSKIFVGSVEHTRNGYDRMLSIQNKYGRLAWPAYSIALSKNKTIEESKEVAHSIMSAIESILHGQGMVLSRRKMIVLGAKGNIGGFLCKYIEGGRLHESNPNVFKVDLKYEGEFGQGYVTLQEMEEDKFLELELFIGVIGQSILTEDLIEKLILKGKSDKLIFASGSTKTLEFTHLSHYLSQLLDMDEPKIQGTPIQISVERILDPQSGIDQGGKIILSFEKDEKMIEKRLYLLADLTPINFLFYGVPTEMMDLVFSELLTSALGMCDQYKNQKLPPPALYAVDREIDRWGKLL
jgi:hypothetical protein